VTRAVDRVARRLQRVTDNGVINLFGGNRAALKRRPRRNRAKLNRPQYAQHADVFAHRRARPAEYQNIFRHSVVSGAQK
jgi:hypothetical protein